MDNFTVGSASTPAPATALLALVGVPVLGLLRRQRKA
jgi:MYXO-CTERM domain-containing protein